MRAEAHERGYSSSPPYLATLRWNKTELLTFHPVILQDLSVDKVRICSGHQLFKKVYNVPIYMHLYVAIIHPSTIERVLGGNVFFAYGKPSGAAG